MIAFLIALPLSVYTLAGFFLLLDQNDPVRSLLRLTMRLLMVALLLALASNAERIWVGVAFLTVVTLHAVFQMVARRAVATDRWLTDPID